MKLTPEQRYRILNELKLENKEGILNQVFDDLTRVFQPFVKVVGPQDYSKEYEINSEELEEFTRDISKFEENGEYWENYRLYESHDDEEILYFDFNRDVIPIIDVIRNDNIKTNKKITLSIPNIRWELLDTVNYYIEKKLGIMPGYYYYEKDHYGTEKCYYVGSSLEKQNDQENTLYRLTEAFPVQTVSRGNWNNRQKDDGDNPFVKARNHAIRQAIENGMDFPIILVTHFYDDLKKKYEVVKTVDYDELIHEYAGPHDYRIEPMYIRGIDITREQAIEHGMYALAKEIEMYELKQEDSDDEAGTN